jgi:rhodanese-related sulfurtransferase
MSLYAEGKVFTGDTLLIRGTGRTDFAGGDAGMQYDSVTKKLFSLPDDTLVYPAHDYRGNTQSSIGEEKRLNPRIANCSRTEYVELMAKLALPLPSKIQEVLQPNQTALDDDRIAFPTIAELNQVRQLSPVEVLALVHSDSPPLVLDVREPNEYSGELGHIPGSRLIPLKDLADHAGELEAYKNKHVIAICRAGVRSSTAAAILTSLGFEQVSNLRGGMLEWNDQKLPVQR